VQDKVDFEELKNRLHKERGIEKISSSTTKLDTLRRSAAAATLQVGSPEWDVYLSFVTGIYENLKDLRKQASMQLESPKLINYEEIIQSKIFFAECNYGMVLLEDILKIPYAIICEREDLKNKKSLIPLPELPKTFCEEL